MTVVRFSILGPVCAWRDQTDLDLGGRQQRVALALLLARTGSAVSISELIDAIWEHQPPTSAVNVVHRYIGILRRMIQPGLQARASGDFLVRHAAAYQLRVDEETVDLMTFRRLVNQARQAADPSVAVRRYADALALWRGPCAAGLEPVSRSHPTFVAIEAERMRVLRDAADAAVGSGQARLVIPALQQAASWSPLDEPLHARLIAALSADGLQAKAIDVYQQVRRRLDTELGTAPGTELSTAYKRVLRQRTGRPSNRPAAPVTEQPAVMLSPIPQGPPVPAQLPSDHPFFTGRVQDIADAESLIAPDHGRARPTVTLAIDGMPGVGKTTFAIHLGHRLAAGFPDGQLYADLRGFGAEGHAMAPKEALRGFLGSFGMSQDMIPDDLHALTGLYRSLLAGRRVLVVLDNARDYEQVRHLLPGGNDSLAIVTSRIRLTNLVGTGGAHLLPLEPPPASEVRQILESRLGPNRIEAHPAAANEIIAKAGRLPLAAALVAARVLAQPQTSLLDFMGEPIPAGTDSHSLGADIGADLATTFSWSYRELSPAAARLFRLLPLHPDAEISVTAAASLAALDARTTKVLLAELSNHMLLAEQDGRYLLHALVGAYARSLSNQQDDARQRRDASDRVLEHYRAAAHIAHLRLDPILPAPLPFTVRAEVVIPTITGRHEAMAWFAAESRVLNTIVRRAGVHTAYDVAWQIALTMQDFLHNTGRTGDWLTIARQGLAAASAAESTVGRGHLHRSLAGARFMTGDFNGAARELTLAQPHLQHADDQRAMAVLQLNWAYLRAQENRHTEAVNHGERALMMFHSGDVRRRAQAMRTVAGSLAVLGRHEESRELLLKTLAMAWTAGDAGGAGHSWDLLGQTYRHMGLLQEATEHWEQAAQTYLQAAIPAALADVLLGLGDTSSCSGEEQAAKSRWEHALAVLPDSAGHSATRLRRRLAAMGDDAVAVLSGR